MGRGTRTLSPYQVPRLTHHGPNSPRLVSKAGQPIYQSRTTHWMKPSNRMLLFGLLMLVEVGCRSRQSNSESKSNIRRFPKARCLAVSEQMILSNQFTRGRHHGFNRSPCRTTKLHHYPLSRAF